MLVTACGRRGGNGRVLGWLHTKVSLSCSLPMSCLAGTIPMRQRPVPRCLWLQDWVSTVGGVVPAMVSFFMPWAAAHDRSTRGLAFIDWAVVATHLFVSVAVGLSVSTKTKAHTTSDYFL